MVEFWRRVSFGQYLLVQSALDSGRNAVEEITGLFDENRQQRALQVASRLMPYVSDGSAAQVDVGVVAALQASFRGGRQAGLERLAVINPSEYGRSRNFLSGAVTRLSPWLRHGVLSLAEVRDAAISQVREPADAEKLVSELGWRDYWQRVMAARPDAIWHNLEPAAARHRTTEITRLPDDVISAQTGMACIDAFSRQLTQTGWLHNHARMWFASWLVHSRRISWQAGAAWFLQHLLDADPASNNFSWQWVAGTFSNKPYIFNRENLERFSAGSLCEICPVRGRCDVEGAYEDLANRLFAGLDERSERLVIPPAPPWHAEAPAGAPLVWLTLDSVAACSPACQQHPKAQAVFVFDPVWLTEEQPAVKRLVFLADCLAEIPGVEIWVGDPVSVLSQRATAIGASHVCVATTACPRVRQSADRLKKILPVVPVEWPRFCDDTRVKDLGRFSRYWNKVSKSAIKPTA